MLYAIFSDIHANPAAFQAAVADARALGAQKFLCLGDVVGYGPDAVGAVKLARETCDVVILGNHDAATAGLISTCNFRLEAQEGVERHRRELDDEAREWLRSLPLVHRARTFLGAHGTIDEPEYFGYIFRADQAWGAFEAMGKSTLLFVGHTHVSMWCTRNGKGLVSAGHDEVLTLKRDQQYIINVGSVGYPRNEPQSIYVLYDSRRRTVGWRRLEFDFQSYFEAMQSKNIYIAPWLRESAAKAGGKKC